jgi:hypothetical protein
LFAIPSEVRPVVRAARGAPIPPLENHAMSGHPIRKEELAVLEAMGRGQPAAYPDEAILERLSKLGLIAQRGGKWSLTERGKMDLTRRKSLKRSSSKS